MKKIAEHTLLLSGDSYEACCGQVRTYFKRTKLVLYDTIEIIDARSFSATDSSFWPSLELVIEKNMKRIRSLIHDLDKSGITTIEDLSRIEQGYPSKLLHLLSHFINVFISTDSVFYNLPDDSHYIPSTTMSSIDQAPDK